MPTEQASLGHKTSSPTSDSRDNTTAASEGRNVPGRTSGKSHRLAVPPESPLASSPGQSRASALSVELEDLIVELQQRAMLDGIRYRRRIKDLERKVGDLKADAMASATQQRLGVASKQQDELISELQAKLLEKDDKLPLSTDGGDVSRVSRISGLARHAGGRQSYEASDGFPEVTSDATVGESNEGSSTPGQDETGHGSEEVEDSGNGSDHEDRTDPSEKPVLSRTASPFAAASPDTGSKSLLRGASNSLASDMKALGLKSPQNMSAAKPQTTGKGNRSPVRTSFKDRPAATDLSKKDLINRRPWDDFTSNVKGREKKAAEEADEKREALKEQGLLPTQASGAMGEVHKKVKIDEHGNRQRIGIDYRVNDPSKKDPARNTLEPEAKGKGNGPAAIEPTTGPQFWMHQHAKAVRVNPFAKPGLASGQGKTSTGEGPAALEQTTAPHIGIQEQAKTAKVSPFDDPNAALDLGMFTRELWDEMLEGRGIFEPDRAPGHVISEYEERGSKPPKVAESADPGSAKAPLENTKDENKPDEKALKPAGTGKGPGTQESADDKSAAKASPAVEPAPGQADYAGAVKAPPPPKQEKKGEQECKGGMVSLGARNLGSSNTAANQQPAGQQTPGQPSQQQGSATRGRGTGRDTGRGTGRGSGIARGGARKDWKCNKCGEPGHIKAHCPHRSGQGGYRGHGGDRGQGGDRGRGGSHA